MQSNQCIECIHYTGEIQCAAFPERIPDEIIEGEFDHSNPHKGDSGIRFEPVSEERE